MKLYNSLSKSKKEFKPLENKQVLIYVCGITPYDTTHLGHGFLYVQFDVLVRYLRLKGYKVNYTQNVTDIDDDILKQAKKTGQNWKELGDFWTNNFLADMKSLNVAMPTHFVKATDSIPKMIKIIEKLIQEGFAYQKKGNVYFEIAKFPEYGKLSRFDKDRMILIAKERGGNIDDPNKKDPLDFLLWQKSSKDEPFWQSPWSKGRPGWHIECSAMIDQYLGSQIDIHGGGGDLIYPHHESEIAQSESYTKKSPFVKTWMHVAMLQYHGEKMSKSLGNLVMVSDLLKKYSPNAIRWVLLSHHYRIPWEFDSLELESANKSLEIILLALGFKNSSESFVDKESIQEFSNDLDDDFNTPQALNLLTQLAANILNTKDPKKGAVLANTLSKLFETMGFKIS